MCLLIREGNEKVLFAYEIPGGFVMFFALSELVSTPIFRKLGKIIEVNFAVIAVKMSAKGLYEHIQIPASD